MGPRVSYRETEESGGRGHCWTAAGEGPLRHRPGRGQGTEGTLEQGAASGQGGAPPPQSWKPKAVTESP